MPERRRAERDTLTGLPDRLCVNLVLRRRFVETDAYGAEGSTWDTVAFRGRIYRDQQQQTVVGGVDRAADQTRATLVTNDGRVCAGDEVAADVEAFASRVGVWLVEAAPFGDVNGQGRAHHYSVPVRQVVG